MNYTLTGLIESVLLYMYVCSRMYIYSFNYICKNVGLTWQSLSWYILKHVEIEKEHVSISQGSLIMDSNMTFFKRFESKPVVKIILIYDRLNLWRHRQFITIFYQFLHIRIEIIDESHMYILFLPRVGLYVSLLPLADAWGKTSWHKGLPVIKNNIYIWLPWIIS